jgi:hypothetical protein
MSITGQLVTAGTSVVAALLASGSALYTAFATRRANREVELLKSALSRESAEEQARRDFEYEARKRVYAECEPIVLKLAESSDYAAARIIGLADPRRWTELRATRDTRSYWMLSRSSELISTAHALLEPLGLFTLLGEKTTLVDLSHDPRLLEIYRLARAAYQVHMNDYTIAALQPALPYDPVVPGWRDKRAENPATYWWQGITRVRLDPAIELCIHRDAGRITTIGEFERRYLELYDTPEDSRAKSLGLFCNPLYDFRPEDRPVYWRMLMCLLLVYRGISRRSRAPADIRTPLRFDFDRVDIDALQRSGALDDEFLGPSVDAALRYAGTVLSGD